MALRWRVQAREPEPGPAASLPLGQARTLEQVSPARQDGAQPQGLEEAAPVSREREWPQPEQPQPEPEQLPGARQDSRNAWYPRLAGRTEARAAAAPRSSDR